MMEGVQNTKNASKGLGLYLTQITNKNLRQLSFSKRVVRVVFVLCNVFIHVLARLTYINFFAV